MDCLRGGELPIVMGAQARTVSLQKSSSLRKKAGQSLTPFIVSRFSLSMSPRSSSEEGLSFYFPCGFAILGGPSSAAPVLPAPLPANNIAQMQLITGVTAGET